MAPQTPTPPAPSMAKASGEKKLDSKKPHITDERITKANWFKHVNWLNVTLIIGVPIYGMITAYYTPLHLKTAIFAFAYYFMTGLGITAGMSAPCSRPESINANLPICRLPQTLGSHLLLCTTSIEDFPRCRRCWCRTRLNPMVVERSPSSSPIHRYRQGPLLCPKGSRLLAYWMDDNEAESKAHRSYRYLRFE